MAKRASDSRVFTVRRLDARSRTCLTSGSQLPLVGASEGNGPRNICVSQMRPSSSAWIPTPTRAYSASRMLALCSGLSIM